ncbi:MAG: hypothetical protein ACU84H_17460 [Gammaproteobacteria bacterium]
MLKRFVTLIKPVGLFFLEMLDWLGRTAIYCLRPLFGSFSWQAPGWLVWL